MLTGNTTILDPLIKREDLPAFKFGREYRVNDEELTTWIEDHRIVPMKTSEEVGQKTR